MLIWLLLMLVNIHSQQHLNHQNNDLLFFHYFLFFPCLYKKQHKFPSLLFFGSFSMWYSSLDWPLLSLFFSVWHVFLVLLHGSFFFSFFFFICVELLSQMCGQKKTYFLLCVFDVYVYISCCVLRNLFIYIHWFILFFFSSCIFFLSCMLINQLRFFCQSTKKNTTVI